MNRRDDSDTLLGFLDGELAPHAKEALLDELQQDPSLRRDYESLAVLARRVEDLPDERVPADFAAQFMAKHAAPSLLQWAQAALAEFKMQAFGGLAMAGGLAAALLFFGGAGEELRPEAGCKLVASAGTASINGRTRGGEVALRLDDSLEFGDDFEGALVYPDGTRIQVKAGTQVVVRSRGLRLNEGGVWLDVTKDLKGFQVETALALAAVKGTEFSVEYDGEAMEVFVDEGLVEVRSQKNHKLLDAGKGARVDASRVVRKIVERSAHSMFSDQAQGGFQLGEETPE